jgi:hypothetical protein
MHFDGKVKFLLDLESTQEFISLRHCILNFEWQKHSNLFNIADIAFKNSGVIQFNYNKLMRHIRPQPVYVKDINTLIDVAMPVVENIKSIFPKHNVLKSHFVALNPSGRQYPHIDSIYYHNFCTRLVIPITGNDKCVSFIGNEEFNLSIGQLYEINNKLIHYSENLGNSIRTYMFVDIYDEGKAYSLNGHYKYSGLVL